MSFDENDYSSAHAAGNAAVTRNLNPALRSTFRRLDPDGGSAVPYFSGASGKTLRVTYTKEVLSVVTDFQVDIAFASNSFAAIIATINSVDASHLEASDQDGFLVLTNKNPGKTHRIQVDPWSVPADDAADLFGFAMVPFPGSVSYAGEIASAPGSRDQENPQGTTLIAKDENLRPEAFNRGLLDLYNKFELLRADLEREVLVYKDFELDFEPHPVTGEVGAFLGDDTVRIPWLDEMIQPPSPSFYSRILANSGSIVVDSTTYDEPVVTNVYYGTVATPLDSGTPMATWGTPDGGIIYDASVPALDKHPNIAITSVAGNILYCSGATFETLLVQKGDLVLVDDTAKSPFDCSGWFAVREVIDEEHIAVRRLSPSERVPSVANRPAYLSSGLVGTITIPIGYYIPAGDLFFQVSQAPQISMMLRVACAVPLREAIANDLGLIPTGDSRSLGAYLYDHILDPAAHGSSSIVGFTSATAWADASTITGATLKTTIEDILTDLASASGSDGSGRVGAAAVAIGGATPNSLSAGTVRSQIIALLTELRDQVNYDGSGSWADTTNIPAQNIESAIDQIVSDLAAATASDDGAGKIGSESRSSGEVAAGTVASQLEAIAANWGKLTRTQSWTALNNFLSGVELDGGSTGDANANPAIFTLAASGGGSAKLLWRIAGGTGAYVRIYTYEGALVDSGVSALAITINAAYGTSGNNWTADTAGQQALIFVLTRNAMHLAIKAATGSDWLDSAWDPAYSFTGSGDLFIENADVATALTAGSAAIGGTDVSSSGAVTVAAGEDVTVSAGGEYKHGEMVLNIPAFMGLPISSGAIAGWDPQQSIALAANFWATPGNSEDVLFAIPLKVGDRIKRIDAYIQDTSGGHTVSLYLHRTDGADDFFTGSALSSGPSTSSGDGTRQTLSLSGLSLTIGAGEFYHALIRHNSATNTTTRLAGIAVTYDRV